MSYAALIRLIDNPRELYINGNQIQLKMYNGGIITKLFTRKLSTIVAHHYHRNSVSGKISFQHFYNLLTIASSCKSVNLEIIR